MKKKCCIILRDSAAVLDITVLLKPGVKLYSYLVIFTVKVYIDVDFSTFLQFYFFPACQRIMKLAENIELVFSCSPLHICFLCSQFFNHFYSRVSCSIVVCASAC
jgi:hypothetical protein